MAKRKPLDAVIPPRQRPAWPLPVALAILAIAVYANTAHNGFIGDDKIQLLENPLVTDPANIPRLFHSSVWAILGIAGNYYRPVQFLLYMLVYQCAGFSATAFHLFLVLVHAANTVLLYFLVRRMSEGRIALAAAALFAVYPIHTETVNWIAALPDLFVTTLGLAGVLWFARGRGKPHGFAIAGHCGIYLLALLTKETGVMLLPLYGGYAFLCLHHRWPEFRRNLPFYSAIFASLAVYLALRTNALGSLAPAQQTFFHLSFGEFVLSAVVMAAQYLGALLWPVNLNYFHIFHATPTITAVFLVSALWLAAVAALFFRTRVALISYGIFWIAVTMAPALNLTGVGQNVFAERYLYLPSVAFCWIAGRAWIGLGLRWKMPAWIAAAAVILACGAETIARNRDWRDDFTLLRVTLSQSPSSGWLHNSMAGAYVERGEFDNALAEERLAAEYEPRSPVFHKNLGNILLAKDPMAAAGEFQKFVALEPGRAESHCDLALALEASGDPRQAAVEYQRALQLDPQFREAAAGYQRTASNLR
ncbi:MAG TPA: glycosyltransferase family 39 protein [Bryobacteraceae bacterium]|nr:glycosyltransferase family 39 protein [Bryobacteraceae bacterium]